MVRISDQAGLLRWLRAKKVKHERLPLSQEGRRWFHGPAHEVTILQINRDERARPNNSIRLELSAGLLVQELPLSAIEVPREFLEQGERDVETASLQDKRI